MPTRCTRSRSSPAAWGAAEGGRDAVGQGPRRDHRRLAARPVGGRQLVRVLEKLTVAGRGNLGRSLARALHARLVPATSGFRMPREGLLFLAVPDAAVHEMAARVASLGPPAGLGVVHVSGALGLDALEPLAGGRIGSFHPLPSF